MYHCGTAPALHPIGNGVYGAVIIAGHGGSQALDLQTAQGGFVEFSLAEQGLYPIVTHKVANAGKDTRPVPSR